MDGTVHAMMKITPTTSWKILPPNTPLISAMLWQILWLFLKSPRMTPQYVLRVQPMTERVPPTAPKLYMAVGTLRIPVAKITISFKLVNNTQTGAYENLPLRKITEAFFRPTVRKFTPSLTCLKTCPSLNSALAPQKVAQQRQWRCL